MNSLIRMDEGSTQHVATETHAIGAGVVLPAPPYPPGAAQFHQQLAAGKGLLHPTASAPVADSCGAEEGVVAALSDAESQLVSSTADRVWPCSKVLAQALSRSDDSLPSVVDCRGCRVLELGSGLGLAGLCAWRAGAASVVLTELGENLPRLRSAVALNHGADACVRVELLDWTRPLPAAVTAEQFDLVLGADVVYWPTLFDPLLTTLQALQGRPRIILCLADRLYRVRDFERRARERGWALRTLSHDAKTHVEGQGEDEQDSSCTRAGASSPAPQLFEMVRGEG
jgi:SAM-dependent methyltransferase